MSSVVLGGTRGIGFALASQLLSQKLFRCVVVTGRSKPAEAMPDGMQFVPMDLSAPEDQLVAACTAVKECAGEALEALFVVAGAAAAGKWNETKASDMVHSYQVNVVGPMVVTQQLVPALEKGSGKLLVNVSTRMASIDDNGSGGAAAYRCSKAALNMWNKNLSVELPHIKCVLYHPGIVGTELLAVTFYGKTAKELIATDAKFASLKTPEKAAAELIAVCMAPTTKSGHFYDYAGKELPW